MIYQLRIVTLGCSLGLEGEFDKLLIREPKIYAIGNLTVVEFDETSKWIVRTDLIQYMVLKQVREDAPQEKSKQS